MFGIIETNISLGEDQHGNTRAADFDSVSKEICYGRSLCHSHLFTMKWPEGFRCAKCGHDQFYETKTRKLKLYECRQCGYQATVIVGTVMEKTHIDLTKWFWAVYLVAHDKRGISAIMLSEDLEVSYKTAWLILHKIRNAMSNRDSQ